MAVLGKSIELPKLSLLDNYEQSAHYQEYDALQKASNEAGERGEIKGRLIRFSVADGFAVYRIEKLRPLTLAHVDWMDGYMVADYVIRGLSVADVKNLLDKQDRFASFFS